MKQRLKPYFETNSNTLGKLFSTILCRPRVGNLRPAKAFYPASDLSLSSGPQTFFFSTTDMHQQSVEMILISWRRPFFWSWPSTRPKIGLNFWRRPFLFGPLEWWRPAGTLLGLNVAHSFNRLLTPDVHV